MAKETKKKYFCTCCGEHKTITEFYMSHSKLYEKNDKRFNICKQCMWDWYDELVSHFSDEKTALFFFCTNFNVIFLKDLVDSAYYQASNMNSTLLKIYMQKVGSLVQYKGKTTLDGDFYNISGPSEESESISVDVDEDDEEYTPPKVTTEIIRRWGSGYTTEEYITLETNYNQFLEAYQHDTPAELLIFKNISKTILESDKARKVGNFSAFEKLNASVSKLLGDANIKPVQTSTIANDDNSCWGVWINRIENERPIGEPEESLKDVDKLGKYIEKWFTRQMKRVMGLEGVNCYDNEN